MLFLLRRHTAYLLLALSLGHILLISAQVQSRSGLPVVQSVAFGVFARVQQFVSGVTDSVGSLWSNYFALRGIVGENEELRRRLIELQGDLQQARAAASQTAALEEALGLSQSLPVPTVTARVLAGAPSPGAFTITIDKGADAGVRSDMPVIARAGVVGRVIGRPTSDAAQVQLLVDRNAHAAVYFEQAGVGGIVGGGNGDPPLRVEFVPNTAKIDAGEQVFTSGQDGIYPRGFLVGRVVDAEPQGIALSVTVQPAVDFSHLEVVLVMLEPLPQAPGQGGGS